MAPSSNVNDSVASVVDCESNNEVDPRLYTAATEGIIEPFMESNQQLDLMVTPIKNTVLHFHITTLTQIPKSTEFVKQILQKCPSLLLQVNANGDTPLHVPARCGHAAIMEVLIECSKAQHEDLESGLGAAKQMLRITNKEGNTALHEAVRSASLAAVKILTREDPEFSYSANLSGETPLFIAAEIGLADVGTEILDACKSPAHGGPGGKTALHAAVRAQNLDMVKKILEKKKYLTKVADQNGWTPLHYAAYYESTLSIVKQLLETDRSTAYAADKVRKMTALHMAAGRGCKEIMEEIISYCPDCYEMVDDKGWNVLHFAMISVSVIELISLLKKFLRVSRSPVTRKDVKGYTPLHVLHVCRPRRYGRVTKEFGFVKPLSNNNRNELMEEIMKMSEVDGTAPYPYGIVRRPIKWRNDGWFTVIEKSKDAHLLVAALIATVTFAAAFTMPGGYKNDGEGQGTAVLSRKTAFQAFVISDGIAMILSLYAVFLHFLIPNLRRLRTSFYGYGIMATLIAMAAMVVAFVTGTYAVLIPTPMLAVANCLVGLSFFLLFLLSLNKFREINLYRKP